MGERKGRNKIQSLQKKWSFQLLAAHLLLFISLIGFVSVIVIKLFNLQWIFLVCLLISIALLFLFLLRKKLSERDVVLFLNRTYPNLEESAQLIIKPTEALSELEKLQLKKIESHLRYDIQTPEHVKRKIRASVTVLVIAIIVAICIFYFPFSLPGYSFQNTASNINILEKKPEIKLPQIKEINVTITPPSYTRKQARNQNQFNILAEQKARINWTIETSRKAGKISLLFSDKSVLHLHSVSKDSTQWKAEKHLAKSGFYQVQIDNQQSELYKLEMLPDKPPVILVQSTVAEKFIKLGEEKKVVVTVSLSDDYGIDSAYIKATTASGSGEAISFKQLSIPFSQFRNGRQRYLLQKQLSLSALNMNAGDELYFYIIAKDNNRQESRSDVFVVRLEDSAQLMSMAGLANALDIKPELFRSERQIIIETEQLLKDKDAISEESFKDRSSRLGTDQELLRLRYGKYLGEETNAEIGIEHDDEHEQSAASDFGNKDKVLDEFSHKHDIAEDADFFDAPTKKQLQAMLAEMWKASLQLKTYQPKAALPFEYNALRLLKDLQQKTRVYVAKTGSQTAPLNLNKRLTGELDKIGQPISKQTQKQKDSLLFMLRKALGILEQIRSGEEIQRDDKDVLKAAETQLSIEASSSPSVYLSSYQALKRVIGNKSTVNDINMAGKGLQKIIRSVNMIPQQSGSKPDMNLSRYYFMNLNSRHD